MAPLVTVNVWPLAVIDVTALPEPLLDIEILGIDGIWSVVAICLPNNLPIPTLFVKEVTSNSRAFTPDIPTLKIVPVSKSAISSNLSDNVVVFMVAPDLLANNKGVWPPSPGTWTLNAPAPPFQLFPVPPTTSITALFFLLFIVRAPVNVPPDKGKYPETVGISVIKANLVLPLVVPTLAYPSLSINKYLLEL